MIQLASRAFTGSMLALLVVLSIVAFARAPDQRRRIVVTDTTVEILQDVSFVGDTISTRSLRTLDAVADTLEGNPSIQLVEVPASSLVRAGACVDYLIGRGVAPERLDAGLRDGPLAAFLIVRRSDTKYSQP